MNYLHRTQVTAETASLTLLDFVLAAWPQVKRKQAKLWLKFRTLLINDTHQSNFAAPLKPGDWVAVRAGKFAAPDTKLPSGLQIAYEDASVIVVEKPPGLLTIATDRGETQTAYYKLTFFLRNRGKNERVYIVHRLDRDTSGLLVFAKTSQAKRTLQSGWEKAEKRYIAIVEGTPSEPQGTFRSHLNESEEPTRSGYRVFSDKPSDKTRPAITHYKTVKSGGAYTLVDITLETGRRNQIRVHFSEAGCPVTGDEKYGAKRDPIRRLALHAASLRFPHPVTGKPQEFKSPAPDNFAKLVAGKEKVESAKKGAPTPARRDSHPSPKTTPAQPKTTSPRKASQRPPSR